MDMIDEMFIDDDDDILDIINFGFPRRILQRASHFEDMDEMTFFRRFRLTKETTLHLMQQIENELEFDNDLNNSVSPMKQLLTTLRFYACAGHQNCIGDFIGVHQTTVSRIVKKVSTVIARLRERYINMPTQHEILQVQNNFFNIAHFPQVVGCIDGTHIKIQSPGGNDAEIFRNRKSYFSLNCQVICDSNLRIRDIVARWPGSAHDLNIFNHSRIRARFEGGDFQNALLLGDSGYMDRNYLMVPLLNPVTRAEQLYNESHIRTRNVVERQIGVWKRRFPVLAYGLRTELETSMAIIVATAVIHNIAMGRNEAVPPPPEHINFQQLNYLIQRGNIPNVPDGANNQPGRMINHRQHLIDQYFSTLRNV